MRPINSVSRSFRTATRRITMALGVAGAFAVSAAPALAHPLPTKPAARTASRATVSSLSAPSGVFRLLMQRRGGVDEQATILIERVGDRIEASLLIDDRITTIEHVRVDGDRITGDVQTSSGRGRVSLDVAGDALTGTLTVGKNVYTVNGTRSA